MTGDSPRLCHAGRVIVRMEIANHESGRRVMEADDIGDSAIVCVAGLDRIEVADVRAQHDAIGGSEGNCCLQVAAEGQHTRGELRGNRRWRVAAGAPDDLRPARDYTDDRIVHRAHDWPVMDEEQVGDAGKALQGFALVDDDGLVGAVAAGRDDRKAEVGEQKLMQRRVGQQRADPRIARRNGVGEPLASPSGEDDRPLARSQERRLLCIDMRHRHGRRERWEHDGEGLFLAVLAPPEAFDRDLVAGIDHEMEAAQPLDRDDSAVAEGLCRRQQRVVALREDTSLRVPERELRSANRNKQSARRENGGRRGLRIRRGNRDTSGRRASTCARGHRADLR